MGSPLAILPIAFGVLLIVLGVKGTYARAIGALTGRMPTLGTEGVSPGSEVTHTSATVVSAGVQAGMSVGDAIRRGFGT